LAGLCSAQLVATAQVYLSTLRLHAEATALHQAGYLEVPTLQALRQPGTIIPAVCGGLFFTLSIGAGITLAATAGAWLWRDVCLRNRPVLMLLLVVWAAGLLMVNANGGNLFGSLYFLMVPPAAFLVYFRLAPKTPGSEGVWKRLMPLIPLAVLALIWGLQADNRLFVNIRDFLLLSNPVGKSINDFYYRYTLYPAEAFKSLEQKLQRPVRLTEIHPAVLARRVESRMRYRDYLPVGKDAPAALLIEQTGERLSWLENGKRVLSVTTESFLSRPDDVLSQVSSRADRSAFLRTVTFFGILLAFPALLYSGLYWILRALTGFFLQPFRAALLTGALCFLVGVLLLVPVYQGGHRPVNAGNLGTALAAVDWRDRVAALKLIGELKLEITAYPSYVRSIVSRHLPERYWLAHALGASTHDRTLADLFTLLDDRQPTVVCQALHALGQRRDSRRAAAIATIGEKIRSTDNWYVQRYAYLTLRSLGWQQPASD
jgi:hypothetical protein